MNTHLATILAVVAQSANLLDIDASVAENPDLFTDREPEAGRRSVERGRLVKLLAGGSAEQFWVLVIDKTQSGVFIGKIDNALQRTDIHGLREGDIIAFGPEHIRYVSYGPEERRPSRYDRPLVMQVELRSLDDRSDKPFAPPLYVDSFGGDYMTVEEFREGVAAGAFTDYDGFAYPVQRDVAATGRSEQIVPSALNRLPDDATHVLWFNK